MRRWSAARLARIANVEPRWSGSRSARRDRQQVDSLRALNQVETMVGGTDEGRGRQLPARAWPCSTVLAWCQRSVALARPAGGPQQVLEAALGSLDAEMVKIRPRLLSALATAHVHKGTSMRHSVSAPRRSRWWTASRPRRTSRTYAGSGCTWGRGGTRRRSWSWTSSSPQLVTLSN
jgi:hypothetical protein